MAFLPPAAFLPPSDDAPEEDWATQRLTGLAPPQSLLHADLDAADEEAVDEAAWEPGAAAAPADEAASAPAAAPTPAPAPVRAASVAAGPSIVDVILGFLTAAAGIATTVVVYFISEINA